MVVVVGDYFHSHSLGHVRWEGITFERLHGTCKCWNHTLPFFPVQDPVLQFRNIQYCRNPQELAPCTTAVPTKAGTMHYRWNSHEGKPSAAAVAASTGTMYACMQHRQHPQVLEPCSIAGTHKTLKPFSTGNTHRYWSHSLLPVPTSVGTMHYYQPHKY